MPKKFNVSTPSGFPEFTPAQEQVRQEWIRIISDVFEKNGFAPITTPLVEREENLLGKGGNPKEMYVLKRLLDDDGDTSHSGNALRFDQTVPLALYVARNFNDLTFPFRRSVIGPVFRGERAQKGRFRQFDQCDIDVIGNGSLSVLNDAQMPSIIIQLFTRLMPKQDFVVRINNRKVLLGFFKSIGIAEDKVKTALDIVDDLEKLTKEQILKNFEREKITVAQADKILDFVSIEGTNENILSMLEGLDNEDVLFQEGISELRAVYEALKAMGTEEKYFVLDLRIARGLDYYTGTVFETNLVGYESLGSICSGGRYEDLAKIFTKKSMPGVGISIGLTRLLSQVFEAGIVKVGKTSRTQILIINADEVALPKSLEVGQKLREAGYFVENYLENKKLGKKFEYADKLNIPYVVVIGENEMSNKCVQTKNLETGEKEDILEEDLVGYFEKLVK